MSTATKLEYLNDTKSLIKDNINLTGAGLTNQTPFRQYATDLKTALLNILNNGIDTLYNNFPKTTGTGTNITLNNTLQAPIRSVINGDTEQKSYSGKNLLNAKDYLYGTSNGIKTTYENNSYVLNGTASASWCYIANNVPINLSEGTYTLSITKALTHRIFITFKFEDNSTGTLAINAGYTSASYTINKKVVSYELSCANMTSGTTYNETIGIQLEQGSATSYEPYVGGQPSPNPDYPQEIKSVTGLQKVKVEGKNLFDNVKPNIYFASNKAFANEQGASTTDYIPAKQGDIFTISVLNRSNGIVIASFDENYNCLERSAISTTSSIRLLTYTCPENTAYIIGSNYNYTDNPTQLEHGSTASEYQEYQTPQEYEINLGKNLFDKDNANILNANLNNNTINNSSSERIFWIKCEPNTTYSFTKLVNSPYTRNTIAETTVIPEIGGSIQNSIYEGNIETFTYTTSSTAKYIVWLGYNTSSTNYTLQEVLDSIQIEKGTEATSYSPYFTPIHLYEGDQIIGIPNNWSVKHVMGKYILDNTKNWYIQSTNNYQVSLGGNDRINLKQSAIGLSNYFRVSSSGNDIFMYPILQGSTDYIRIVNAINKWETIEDFKTFISNNNVELVYELAEPTTEPITNTELIEDLNNFYNAKSYNGQTNISVEGDLPMILDVSAIIDE